MYKSNTCAQCKSPLLETDVLASQAAQLAFVLNVFNVYHSRMQRDTVDGLPLPDVLESRAVTIAAAAIHSL